MGSTAKLVDSVSFLKPKAALASTFALWSYGGREEYVIAFSNLRSIPCRPSSEVEHFHGKEGVTGSIPVGGSSLRSLAKNHSRMLCGFFSHTGEELRLAGQQIG